VRGRKKLSPNAERKARARAEEKIGKARERLARLDAGGEPDRPIEVVSASVVEAQAKSIPCPKCLGPCRIEEHAAETLAGQRLRIARVTCAHCGARRAIYFRIVGDVVN
jgi:hypothetical protein